MEVGLAVGGSFLGAFLGVAFDRIASCRKLTGLFQGKRKLQLNRLERALQTISVVLEDAENKQAKSPAVRSWFNSLKQAVHQADDFLDEINTERLRIKVHDFEATFSDIVFNDQFVEELLPSLEDNCDILESYISQIGVLGLKILDTKQKPADRPPSTSVVIQSQIFGRDDEKEKIIQLLLSGEGDSDVSVIPFTGMGGVGKTTLAQLVYNDERVKNHFKTRAWVCVSEDYDCHRVSKTLLMEVNSSVVNGNDDLNRVQVKLKDSLEARRFLIILDDIWNDNYSDCQRLILPLNSGSRGSKIIVTTRNENIALMLQNEPFHCLQPITDDKSWDLFKLHAFDNGARTSLLEFETIGRAIVEKCKGLPLAIKTVAGALRSKREICDWHDILSSEIWMAGGDVLPGLSLSYELLPSHLKCCFAFCAIFPKDIPFAKEEVALLWMANDLVRPSTQKVGISYFEELRSRSFFEMVNGNNYLMHDMVNDLARHVSGNFCVRLEDYQSKDLHQGIQGENDLPPEVLHISYLSNHCDASKRFSGLAQVQSLRTFIPVQRPLKRFQPEPFPNFITSLFFSNILPRFTRIRALSLRGYSISVLPDSIGDLKHLRFFNLAMNRIKKLPNAISKCLNLQTLILEKCLYLEALPEDMRHLINLQHLDVRGVRSTLIDKMASWISTLKDIQNLSIVVDTIHGSVLDQLDKLQLCQVLRITGLGNGVTTEIAKNAELKNKNCIGYLSLEWSLGIAESSEHELNIFDELQPHRNTEHLNINGYRGTTFPDWLGDSLFGNMKTLYLQNCKNCYYLPPLGQLIALKKLHISGMDGITVVGEEFYGNSSVSKPFQTLEELRFTNMAEWTIWETHLDSVEFSSLKEFCIEDCPKLVGDIPIRLTCLRKLVIRRLPNLQVANISALQSLTQGMNHLHILEVCGCPGLVSSLNHVDKLVIRDCPSLSLSLQSSVMKVLVIEKFGQLEFPTGDSINFCLESLKIENCGDSIESIPLCSFSKLRKVHINNWENPKLFKFPNGLHQNLIALQSLVLRNCDNILCFPEGGLQAPSLKELGIFDCKRLKSLPEQMHTGLSSLQYLDILNCPEIECFPEGGLPSSLEKLDVINCKKLMISRNNWGLQTLMSLRVFSFRGVDDMLFPEEGLLPTGLHVLLIMDCPNLEALDDKGLRHITSLQDLYIYDCPNLRYLPEDGLPSSLTKLWINNCPKLTGRMEREKGEEWHKVSHIPIIKVDEEVIS